MKQFAEAKTGGNVSLNFAQREGGRSDRYGDEEFAVFLPEADLMGACPSPARGRSAAGCRPQSIGHHDQRGRRSWAESMLTGDITEVKDKSKKAVNNE